MDEYHTGIAFLIGLGAFIGVVNGLLGIASTATFVSAMLVGLPYFFGIEGPDTAKIALASSVGLIVPTAIASTQAQLARGAVDWWLLAWFTPSVMAGAFVASSFAFAFSARLLMIVMAVLAFLFAWQMMAGIQQHRVHQFQPRRPPLLPLTLRGLMGSAWCSLLGLNATLFAVPLLSRHLPMVRAAGTATALSVPLSLAAVTGYLLANTPDVCKGMCTGYIFLPAVAAADLGAVLTAPLGVALAHYQPARLWRRIWGIWLLFAGGHILISAVDPVQVAKALRQASTEARLMAERAELALWPERAPAAAPELPRWMATEQAPTFTLVAAYGPQRAFLPLLVPRDETGPQAARVLFARIERNQPGSFAPEAIAQDIAAALATVRKPASPRKAPVPSRTTAMTAAKPPLPSRRKETHPQPGSLRPAGVAQEQPPQLIPFGQ